jgi:hypothetical protein
MKMQVAASVEHYFALTETNKWSSSDNVVYIK